MKILLAFALLGLALADRGDADLRRAFNTAQAQKFEDGLWHTTVGRERYSILPRTTPSLFKMITGQLVRNYTPLSFD